MKYLNKSSFIFKYHKNMSKIVIVALINRLLLKLVTVKVIEDGMQKYYYYALLQVLNCDTLYWLCTILVCFARCYTCDVMLHQNYKLSSFASYCVNVESDGNCNQCTCHRDVHWFKV